MRRNLRNSISVLRDNIVNGNFQKRVLYLIGQEAQLITSICLSLAVSQGFSDELSVKLSMPNIHPSISQSIPLFTHLFPPSGLAFFCSSPSSLSAVCWHSTSPPKRRRGRGHWRRQNGRWWQRRRMTTNSGYRRIQNSLGYGGSPFFKKYNNLWVKFENFDLKIRCGVCWPRRDNS